ncbi:glycoside hydrolase family 3 protein [Arsenicicoccus piscis]|nr:glycoside hydrolase family 3 protein [Arsenicicoccus piscis]
MRAEGGRGDESRAERAGQLLMVAEPAGGSGGALDAAIRNQHVGNVFFLGGWTGRAQVSATAKRLAAAAGPSTGEVGLLVAADQEGGAVQQLKGEGFTRIPSARVQANGSPAAVTQTFRTVGAELKATGVNVDLAPVADAVPASLGKANKPIGYWGREYASTPAQAAPFVAAATRGLRSAGVAATVKHFPGLGRITGNTDLTTEGITDSVTTGSAADLAAFKAGIDAGAQLVMVSSARYPKIDPDNQAVFSPKVIQGALRQGLGYDGVVTTDDVAAVALQGTPAGQRATRFVASGGDLLVVGQVGLARPMASALVAKAAADPAFAAKVTASATRIVTLKTTLGLTPCKR